MDILGTSEGEKPIPRPVTEVAPATHVEDVIAKAITTGVAPTEVALDEVTNTEVTTIMTSTSLGNDHNISFSDYFSYIISNFNCFAEIIVATAPSAEVPREKVIVPPD